MHVQYCTTARPDEVDHRLCLFLALCHLHLLYSPLPFDTTVLPHLDLCDQLTLPHGRISAFLTVPRELSLVVVVRAWVANLFTRQGLRGESGLELYFFIMVDKGCVFE